jgi:hypothetical protein
METGVVVAAVVGAAVIVAILRTRLPGPLSAVLLATASAALAWGLVNHRPDPSTVEVALAVTGMAVLGPVHVRAVLGPFGPR